MEGGAGLGLAPPRTRPAGKQAGHRSVSKAGPGMDGPAASPTTPARLAPARPNLVPGPYDTCPLDEPRAGATQLRPRPLRHLRTGPVRNLFSPVASFYEC